MAAEAIATRLSLLSLRDLAARWLSEQCFRHLIILVSNQLAPTSNSSSAPDHPLSTISRVNQRATAAAAYTSMHNRHFAWRASAIRLGCKRDVPGPRNTGLRSRKHHMQLQYHRPPSRPTPYCFHLSASLRTCTLSPSSTCCVGEC